MPNKYDHLDLGSVQITRSKESDGRTQISLRAKAMARQILTHTVLRICPCHIGKKELILTQAKDKIEARRIDHWGTIVGVLFCFLTSHLRMDTHEG